MTHPAKTPPPHTIAVDTSVVWHGDKAEVVSPDFAEFLSAHTELMDLQLIVPAVVRGELLFQQTTSALKALQRANDNLERVSAITSKNYSHRVTERRVRREVEERLDAWLASKNARVVEVPLDELDWAQLIEASIWRKPPFSFDEKNPGLEKGFRDALILECVAQACGADSQRDFAFVCGDRLLREAAEDRIGALAHVATYESIDDFESYLRLTQENLRDEFVRSIRDKARQKFYTRNDPDCLLQRESLLRRFREEFEAEMRPGDPGSVVNFIEGKKWEPADNGVFRLGSTQFVTLEDPRDFHWSTEITYGREYRRSERATNLFEVVSTESVVGLRIVVHWHAEVRSNGAFFGTQVDDIELLEREFSPATEELRERYGLGRSA